MFVSVWIVRPAMYMSLPLLTYTDRLVTPRRVVGMRFSRVLDINRFQRWARRAPRGGTRPVRI